MLHVADRVEELLAVVREADDVVLSVFESSAGVTIESKIDDSPVIKELDIAIHRILMDGIARLFPAIPIVSEEGNQGENRQIVNSARAFWLVDPIDGTKEAIKDLARPMPKRTGDFAVCAALVEENLPIWGVVSAPAKGQLYYGGQEGSYRQWVNEPLQQLRVKRHDPPIIVIRNSTHLDKPTTDYIAEHFPESEVRPVGSQLKLPRIAEGDADICPYLKNGLYHWDLAAGHAILLGAGGEVRRFENGRLDGQIDYHNPNLLVGGFIASNNLVTLPR